MTLNNRENLSVFKNPIFIKVNLATHICPARNWQLFLILTHWSYCKCEDTLHTLNVFKIPAKEHQVVDRWSGDEYQFQKFCFKKV